MAEKKKKEPTIVVDLRKKVKMKVTEKGAEMTTNDWKVGHIIEVSESLAVYFKDQGVAVPLK